MPPSPRRKISSGTAFYLKRCFTVHRLIPPSTENKRCGVKLYTIVPSSGPLRFLRCNNSVSSTTVVQYLLLAFTHYYLFHADILKLPLRILPVRGLYALILFPIFRSTIHST